MKVRTMAEIMDEAAPHIAAKAARLKDGFKRGRWEWFPRPMLLIYLGDGWGYEVDVNNMSTSAAILDWVAQVSGKPWATSEVVGDLIGSIDEILAVQARYCSFGKERGPHRPQRVVETNIASLEAMAGAVNPDATPT